MSQCRKAGRRGIEPQELLLCILPGCSVSLLDNVRDRFLAGLARVNVACKLILRGRIQKSHIASVSARECSDTLKRCKNISHDNRHLRGSNGCQGLI